MQGRRHDPPPAKAHPAGLGATACSRQRLDPPAPSWATGRWPRATGNAFKLAEPRLRHGRRKSGTGRACRSGAGRIALLRPESHEVAFFAAPHHAGVDLRNAHSCTQDPHRGSPVRRPEPPPQQLFVFESHCWPIACIAGRYPPWKPGAGLLGQSARGAAWARGPRQRRQCRDRAGKTSVCTPAPVRAHLCLLPCVCLCVFLCMRILHTRVSACVVFARAPSFALFPLLHMMGEDEDTAHLPASQTTSQS